MKYCPKCGKALIENSAFCMYCGERIDILTESDSKKKDMAKGSRKKLIIACAMIGVICKFRSHKSICTGKEVHLHGK